MLKYVQMNQKKTSKKKIFFRKQKKTPVIHLILTLDKDETKVKKHKQPHANIPHEFRYNQIFNKF